MKIIEIRRNLYENLRHFQDLSMKCSRFSRTHPGIVESISDGILRHSQNDSQACSINALSTGSSNSYTPQQAIAHRDGQDDLSPNSTTGLSKAPFNPRGGDRPQAPALAKSAAAAAPAVVAVVALSDLLIKFLSGGFRDSFLIENYVWPIAFS